MKNTPIIENRKARYDYFVEETLECGIVLRGNEVKTMRQGMASIKEAWIDISSGELWVKQMHITPWETSNKFDIEAKREVKLLAHRREINKWYNKVRLDGYTIIPLKIYFTKNGKCKMLIGLCKGKKNYDKRASEKVRDTRREMRNY